MPKRDEIGEAMRDALNASIQSRRAREIRREGKTPPPARVVPLPPCARCEKPVEDVEDVPVEYWDSYPLFCSKYCASLAAEYVSHTAQTLKVIPDLSGLTVEWRPPPENRGRKPA